MDPTEGTSHISDAPEPSGFSLLWPAGASSAAQSARTQLSPSAWRDLGLQNLVLAFSSDSEHQHEIAKIFATLVQDPVVLEYRQQVLSDLIDHPELAARLEALIPTIDALSRFSYRPIKDTNALHEVTWRLGELQSLLDCVQGLGTVFEQVGEGLQSSGFRAFRAAVAQMQSDPTFQAMAKELPELLRQIRACSSVTIGVNLDPYLRPVEATLLAVNTKRFTAPAVLAKLFGKQLDPMEGIAPLHSVPKRSTGGSYDLPVSAELGYAVDPMMVPLFADLAKVIEKSTQPVAQRLKAYTELNAKLFIHLRKELVFYLGALRFIHKLQQLGLPNCRPQIAPREERICQVEGGYNVNLALHVGRYTGGESTAQRITQNDVFFGEPGRIFILTGPNQGGKTTYMQGIALIQVLAQVGCWAPGCQARISPVDQILTHFPIEEKPDADAGRFGEEAQRLGEIFQQVTRCSLVLLNESLASTSAGESVYIAQDVVRILRRLGASAIFATHLHELADHIDEMNATTPGDSRIASLVSSPVANGDDRASGHPRSYKVELRPPLGQSYAREIAARYGVSYEQLEQGLIERGQLEE